MKNTIDDPFYEGQKMSLGSQMIFRYVLKHLKLWITKSIIRRFDENTPFSEITFASEAQDGDEESLIESLMDTRNEMKLSLKEWMKRPKDQVYLTPHFYQHFEIRGVSDV